MEKMKRKFNYRCPKCNSNYKDLSKELDYSYCQTPKGRNPNPIVCGGKLIEIKK